MRIPNSVLQQFDRLEGMFTGQMNIQKICIR